ncbi:MAG TPA: hypothetical protein VGK67_30485 [Myxococcales bacterium]|jgi:hypothetical protein
MGEEILLTLLAIVLGSAFVLAPMLVGLVAANVGTREEERQWGAAAKALGLDFDGGIMKRRSMAGTLASFLVQVHGETGKGEDRSIFLEISSPQLPLADVVALLDEECRERALRQPGRKSVTVGDHKVWAWPGESKDARTLERWVREIVGAAEALSRIPIPEALASRATGREDVQVRLKCLEMLLERYPDDAQTARALEAGLSDADPLLRLRAARSTRDARGLAVLEALVFGPEVPVEIRVEALGWLVPRNPPQSGSVLLERALEGPAAVQSSALIHALDAGRSDLLGAVRRVAAGEVVDAGLALALARFLGKHGDGRDEPALLKLLGVDSGEARFAVVGALRRFGTARAVEPLLGLEGKVGEHAIRDAIRAIQARLGDADAGRLSMVDVSASVGAVSLEPPKAGEKSGTGG